MLTEHDLRRILHELDGQGYRAYKRIGGEYRYPTFTLRVDHVQGDPFADPSRVRVRVPPEHARLPADLLETDARRVTVADFLNRALARALHDASRVRGSGKSGELRILEPGQEVLRRTSLLVHPDGTVEARVRAGLPARGRTVLGGEAAELLCAALPRAVAAGLLAESRDEAALRTHVEVVEDARALRAQLAERGLVAFVADGAVLPRRSGVDDRPLEAERAVAFRAPDSLRVSLRAPHAGGVTGMGIPAGVTLLVGGGFHGKSTLLRAIERGVYDHPPGDGRERVVTMHAAVKVRAEDGRQISGTDISSSIGALPGAASTSRFHTANASGSTSQAAAIAEALEVGARCLLLDEDTSATNFLIRDARVQALIDRAHEPITPFVDQVRHLWTQSGVSTVLVVGGSGDYFDVADTVIAMREYQPWDATARAREVTERYPSLRAPEAPRWNPPAPRVVLPESLDPSRGHREVEVKAYAAERVRFGEEELELAAVEQLVEPAQTLAIARALAWGRDRCLDGARPVPEALACIMEELAAQGLDALDPRIVGDYAEFRIYELNAVMSRVRGLKVADGG